jgi:Xaa-Pro aminopeptidase
MSLFSRVDLTAVGPALEANQVDGWLLFDFHGLNPIVKRVVGYSGMASRRLFVWLPKDGPPVAVAHRIELQGMEGFPGEVRPYAAWQELHRLVGEIVSGKKVAMEVSPDDAVPYLDRVPAGVVELIQRLGGTVVPSATLVSLFAARWSSAELEGHRAAAEKLADIARSTIREVVSQVGKAREVAVRRQVLQAMENSGLTTDHPPIVAFGPNTAIPHYEPREGSDAVLKDGDVVLVDLWGGPTLKSVFADQTWMGFAGSAPPDDVLHVWTTTRDARDAVVEYLERAVGEGRSVTGADLDDVARGHITKEGYGDAFLHRTGHSIDTDLHGSGPHLDNFETNDLREVLPGTGFSVEPGIYLEGRFGIRSEINVYLDDTGPLPTPVERQQDLITQSL